MKLGEYSKRLRKQHRAKEAASLAEVGPGQLGQPTSRPSQPPFDLAAIQVIYSPEARRHASSHSPSAAEEQRRERYHLEEERVELVLMLTNSYFYASTIHEKGPKRCIGSSTNEFHEFW
jgi:hypothetical protein